MKYLYKGKSYNRYDLIDALKEQGKYLDMYDKIRDSEEYRIMDKMAHTIEENTERILISELLGEGVVEKVKKPVSKEKLERVRHILKEAVVWDLTSLESQGYVDRHEQVIEGYCNSVDYGQDWADRAQEDLENLDWYIENYVDEEYADALIAWGKEIH